MRVFCGIALSLAFVANSGYAQQPMQPIDLTPSGDQSAKKNITPPRIIYAAEAEFSEEALQKHISGICIVSVTIDVQGMPQEVKIVRCTDPSFEANSLNAVKQYRFKPATTHAGTPVPAKVDVEIDYHLYGRAIPGQKISYAFGSPPGMTTDKPGPDGVYPLTKTDTPPVVKKFYDEGYEDAAFPLPVNSTCDLALTISAKGKASDPQVIHCEKQSLEKPAIASALQSHYKPGKVGGKAVPMWVTLHLEIEAASPEPEGTSK